MFKEVKPLQGSAFIHITQHSLLLSKKIIDEYLKDGRISIYLDSGNKKVGIKSNPNGQYKITRKHHSYTVRCAEICRSINGYFFPKWSDKHQMLIFSY